MNWITSNIQHIYIYIHTPKGDIKVRERKGIHMKSKILMIYFNSIHINGGECKKYGYRKSDNTVKNVEIFQQTCHAIYLYMIIWAAEGQKQKSRYIFVSFRGSTSSSRPHKFCAVQTLKWILNHRGPQNNASHMYSGYCLRFVGPLPLPPP